MKTKICTKCGEEKSLDNFNKQKGGKLGLRASCKLCVKQYREDNKEQISNTHKIWVENNREHRTTYLKQWRVDNKEHRRVYDAKRYAENKEEEKLRVKLYKKNNKEKVRIYERERRRNNKVLRLNDNIRRAISKSFENNGYTKNSSTAEILGCSYDDFIQHIQSQFQEGMTWNNKGEWHLDHIIPVSSYKDEDELIKLNHYTNFQPLWAEDNMKKGDSYLEKDKQRYLEQLSRTQKIKQ